MILTRLLLIGVIYGFGFMVVKSLFPEPFILFVLQGAGGSSEGNLTTVSLVYMGSGLVAGLIAAPVFGGILLARRGSRRIEATSFVPRFVLSLVLALFMGLISALLILLAYATGILSTGGVLDPLALIGASNFPTGIPLLIAWSIARDLLPAGLTGLFLAPLCGDMLQKLYAPETGPLQKEYDWD